MRLFWIFIALLMVVLPVAAVNDTEAAIKFTKDFAPVGVTAVEVNYAGNMAFAGLSNGSIVAMDSDGDVLYNVFAGEAPERIHSDNNGNIVYLSPDNWFGYIRNDGVFTFGPGHSTAQNISSVDIGADGIWFMQVNNIPIGGGGIYIRDMWGNILYSNTTYGAYTNWSTGAFDSVNNLVVAANTTNSSIFLWNISQWTGWQNFNPSHVPKNASQTILDAFPYRYNISIGNGATASVSLGFTPNTSAVGYCNITKKSAAEYWYNTSCGQYFLWTQANNISHASQQSVLLNWSSYNSTSGVYNVTFKVNSFINNLTMYYGDPSYTNRIIENNWSINNGTVIYENFTGTSTWTAPPGVYAVNLTLIGAGGGGGAGEYSSGTGKGGVGGSAGTVTTITNLKVSPGTSYPVGVGVGGAGAGSGDGAAGGTSSFNTSNTSAGGAGGTGDAAGDNGAAGAAGTTTYLPYSNSTSGAHSYYKDWIGGACINQYYNGGAAASGYGAGGGGGAGQADASFPCAPGAGGAGANGFVQVSYVVNDIPKFLHGTAPTSSAFSTRMNVTNSSALNYVSHIILTGNVQTLSIPPGGGTVAVGTATKVYTQQISETGFGTQYSGNSEAGNSARIAAADSGAYFIEARSSGIDIYQMDGTESGHYSTGGTVSSVDIAALNGLYAIGGSSDGKDYIFSKDDSSGWLVYYLSDAASQVVDVAMTDHGEYAASGRSSGVFTYYDLQSVPLGSASSFSADIFVHKGGAIYSGVNMTITCPGYENQTGNTDSDGKFVFNAIERNTYTIYVGNNEYIGTYMGSPNYKVITINVPVPIITSPWEWNVVYNTTSKLISYTYTDVDAADVNIRIYDENLKTNVVDIDYLGVTSVDANYTIPDDTHTYKVVLDSTRTTGAHVQDSVNIRPGGNFFKNLPSDLAFIAQIIYLMIIVLVCMTITKSNVGVGGVLIGILWVVGIAIGVVQLSLAPESVALNGFVGLCVLAMGKDLIN